MAKDPICPIYYNDLLGATRDWTDEEFGCYVRLLLEQWDKGFIPSPYQKSTKNAPKGLPKNYQRLTRICTSIETNWDVVGKKFIECPDGLVNITMEQIRTKRLKFKEKQKENREKGYQTTYQNSTKPSTKHPTKTEPPLENEYIDSIIKVIEDSNGYTIAEEEKKTFMFLVVEMAKVFMDKNPAYYFDKESDYSACLQIAYKIAEIKNWKKADVVNGKLQDCLNSWKYLVEFISEDDWFKTRSLSHINGIKEWQSLIQKLTNKKKKPGKENINSFI